MIIDVKHGLVSYLHRSQSPWAGREGEEIGCERKRGSGSLQSFPGENESLGNCLKIWVKAAAVILNVGGATWCP